MATIQDIHALEQRITDLVEDYILKFHNEDDVLAIGRRCGKIILKADAKEIIKVGKTTELYPLKELVRTGANGMPEQITINRLQLRTSGYSWINM